MTQLLIFLTKKILKFYDPEKICIATDILNLNGKNLVSVSGWQESSSITVEDLIKDLSKYKLKHVLCTDISKDGTLKGPNFKLYSSSLAESGIKEKLAENAVAAKQAATQAASHAATQLEV